MQKSLLWNLYIISSFIFMCHTNAIFLLRLFLFFRFMGIRILGLVVLPHWILAINGIGFNVFREWDALSFLKWLSTIIGGSSWILVSLWNNFSFSIIQNNSLYKLMSIHVYNMLTYYFLNLINHYFKRFWMIVISIGDGDCLHFDKIDGVLKNLLIRRVLEVLHWVLFDSCHLLKVYKSLY